MFFLAPRCSSLFPGILGAEVDDAWNDSWRRCFTTCLYLAAKPSHVGVHVDGLSYPYTILQPAVIRRGDMASLPGTILSHCYSGHLFRDVKPPGLDIWWRVDSLGTYLTKFYTEYIVFSWICLPYVKAIMAIRHVSLV
jgi:hypothetical protein